MSDLMITEIIDTIQGESSYAGYPCTIIRLWGCNLRCSWCDTKYSYQDKATKMNITNIMKKIKLIGNQIVEITGGEPLIQEKTPILINELINKNYIVLLETNGTVSLKNINPKTHIIIDIKCPDSKMSNKNLWENLNYLKPSDEIKFVIASKKDFDWAIQLIKKYKLEKKHNILLSPVFNKIKSKTLALWIIKSKLKNTRLNLQIHKYIWGTNTRGV